MQNLYFTRSYFRKNKKTKNLASGTPPRGGYTPTLLAATRLAATKKTGPQRGRSSLQKTQPRHFAASVDRMKFATSSWNCFSTPSFT